MWSSAEPLAVSPEHRQILERWVRAPSTPQNIVTRARVVLMAAEGAANNRIASELGVSRSTVILWRARFAEGAVSGAARSSGAVGMAVADRQKADVKGKRIAKLLKAFAGKDAAAGQATRPGKSR